MKWSGLRRSDPDRYILYGWWGLFFERPWGLRGMENIMTDYHVYPECVARLHAALAEQYCRYIDWGARVLNPYGFWTSDDLGHQTQLMMRPGAFRDLIKPAYARIGETLAEHSMHWWLHSCGYTPRSWETSPRRAWTSPTQSRRARWTRQGWRVNTATARGQRTASGSSCLETWGTRGGRLVGSHAAAARHGRLVAVRRPGVE